MTKPELMAMCAESLGCLVEVKEVLAELEEEAVLARVNRTIGALAKALAEGRSA